MAHFFIGVPGKVFDEAVAIGNKRCLRFFEFSKQGSGLTCRLQVAVACKLGINLALPSDASDAFRNVALG